MHLIYPGEQAMFGLYAVMVLGRIRHIVGICCEDFQLHTTHRGNIRSLLYHIVRVVCCINVTR